MAQSKSAVQFGAGNIGRGFMGQLLFEAGYHTTFVDADTKLVEFLNQRRQYPLRILNAYTKQASDIVIGRCDALCVDAVREIEKATCDCEMVATAVGLGNLAAIAPLLAEGIKLRREKNHVPLDIYLCENSADAADVLRTAVLQLLDEETRSWAESNIGFVGTSVARMVPAASDRFGVDDPLFVAADAHHKLPVDGRALRSPLPAIEGLYAVDNYDIEITRKLYTHNLGHAALAYLGYLKGLEYIHQGFEHEFICSVFDGALDETSRAMAEHYGPDFDTKEHEEVRRDVRVRFGNPLMMDTVFRVARDPIRKLGPDDRIIGSAKLCLEHDIFPGNIATIAAAALLYDHPRDEKAQELQQIIASDSVESVLQHVCGVSPQSRFAGKVLAAYRWRLES
jgi:mannitol-1-phosphate 5-dehydrogenase